MATDPIIEAYQKYTGRNPEQQGYDYWKKQLDSGAEIDWGKQFEADTGTKDMRDRITSDYTDVFGSGSPGSGLYSADAIDASGRSTLIDKYIQNALGREATQDDLDYWLGDSASGMNRFERAYGDDYDLSDDLKAWADSQGSSITAPALPSMSSYMDPYLEEVLQNTIRDITKSGDMRRNQLGTEAFMSGAYGDGRHGVESAALTEDLMRTIGDASASGRSNAWNSGMNWRNADASRQTQVALANAGFADSAADRSLNAAMLGNNMLTGNANLAASWLGSLTDMDNYFRGWEQQGLNTNYNDFIERDAWDQSQFQSFMNFLNGMPGQSTSVRTQAGDDFSNWQSFGSSLGGINWGDIFKNLNLN